MKQSSFLLIFVLAAFSAFNISAQIHISTIEPGKLQKSLGGLLDSLSAKDEFSGVVLIAKGENTVFAKAYGAADKSAKRMNTIDTKFNLGSCNKMFTGVAIAQLAEQGKLSFGDKVGKYLPDYPNETVRENVTIRQLLTHTSGLGDFFNPKFDEARTRLRTVASYFPLFASDSLQFAPGEKYQYSNAGFVVLGAIVEKVSGEDYYSYVKKHIFIPAGMTGTGFYGDDTVSEKQSAAIGYTDMGPDHRRMEGGQRNPNTDILEPRGGPAGGGYSTAGDLLKFRLALFGNKLLNAAYTDSVVTGKVPTRFGLYGYGFGNERVPDGFVIGHTGGAPGVYARLDMYRESGHTVVVLSNFDPPAPGDQTLTDRIHQLLH
jgi:CubicO group peptidase (beta-lactamase class C family)